MKIEIRNHMKLLGSDAVARTHGRIEAVFSRYIRRIKSVTLTAKDVNGPRGGVDKQCRMLISIGGIGDVVSTVDDRSLSKAIGMAIERGERAVARRLQKARKMKTRSRK